jgi:arylsulfatase A-like enzyme
MKVLLWQVRVACAALNILAICVWLTLPVFAEDRTANVHRPNVLVILSDDQGWGDLSLNGNRNLQTPNIDRLAEQGASFDRFFVCPVCSPTRAEFLTGRYHPRSNVYATSSGGERMNLDEITIADTFRAAGYATAAFGKWHNGMQYPYHPCGRGFDEYYGFCSGHWGDYFSPQLEHNGRLVKGNGFIIDDFTDHAIEFMEHQQSANRPFFVYLPLNTPHSPMQVPDQWWDKFKNKELEQLNRDSEKEDVPHTRAALAMCENIDWNVGRILQRLEERKFAQNTIVVYFCDNGPNGVRWNGGMKGRKGSTDEGGVRSPLIVRWPAKIKPATKVLPIAAAIDLLPTLADLAEIPTINKKPLDGKSLQPLLVGDGLRWTDREIFSHWNNRVSVRSQQFRLDTQGKLYDLSADPGQNRDVSAEHPDETIRLQKLVEKWREELLSDLGKDERMFPLGSKDFAYTQIPARDGTAHGNIRLSNKFPNCAFFTNWVSTEDRITWPVEVLATGTYRVELYYTCAPENVGTELKLTLGEENVSAKVTQAHDPPLMGAEHDRVPRTESYVKDFIPLDMGTIQMKPGKSELQLQATEIPGNAGIDFRLLMFTRQE